MILLLTLSLLIAQSLPPSVKQLDIPGTFTEPLSQLDFPIRAEGWDREQILKYPDPGGHSVTYELREQSSTKARATIYVYPHEGWMPGSLKAHFAATLDEVRQDHAEAEVTSEKEYPVGNGEHAIQVHMATLLYRWGYGPFREPAVGFLTLSKLGTYWLKWRITLPASAADEVTPKMAQLMSAFVPKK